MQKNEIVYKNKLAKQILVVDSFTISVLPHNFVFSSDRMTCL